MTGCAGRRSSKRSVRGDQGTSLSSLKKHRYVLEVSERQDHEISLQNIQGPLDQSCKGLKFGLLFPERGDEAAINHR